MLVDPLVSTTGVCCLQWDINTYLTVTVERVTTFFSTTLDRHCLKCMSFLIKMSKGDVSFANLVQIFLMVIIMQRYKKGVLQKQTVDRKEK